MAVPLPHAFAERGPLDPEWVHGTGDDAERVGAVSKPQRRECLPARKESIPFPKTLAVWAHLLTHGRATNLLA